MLKQDREHRGIPGLAGSAYGHQRHPSAVDQQVNLGAEPASRAANAVVSR